MRSIFLSALSLCVVFASHLQAQDQEVDLKQLVKDVNHSDKAVRIQSLDGIAELGADGADAVPALVETLKDSDEEIVWHAARTLGAIGESAATAVPNLAAVLGDDRPKVRAYAAFALGRIGKPATSRRVGYRSMPITGVSTTLPALAYPGHLIMSGTLIPPSQ